MAGHSKWANIRHRKGRQDAERGKRFSKLIREITVAARAGGTDARANPRLRAAVDDALANNMTKDTIERAIKRGAGAVDGAALEEVRYEGYGPAGVAVMVDCMTDNRNRTVSEVRHAFARAGGNLGQDGSVAFLFHKCGVLTLAPGTDTDALMEATVEAGADDIVDNEDGSVDVLTSPEKFGSVKDALVARGFVVAGAQVTMRSTVNIPLQGEDAEKLFRLLETLDELDDVQRVYSNAEFSDETLAAIG
jgi:YebC/PmpR family DNA-binding regulatory protein